MWLAVAAGLAALFYVTLNTQAQIGALSFDTLDDLDEVDMTTPGHSTGLQEFAEAIASAEGFYVPGSAPQRANNPGDLKVPGWTGPVTGAEGVSVFGTPDEGWRRLYAQLQLIVNTGDPNAAASRSHVYNLSMTIREMAAHWTDTQADNWTANVVAKMHAFGASWVTENTRLSEVLL